MKDLAAMTPEQRSQRGFEESACDMTFDQCVPEETINNWLRRVDAHRRRPQAKMGAAWPRLEKHYTQLRDADRKAGKVAMLDKLIARYQKERSPHVTRDFLVADLLALADELEKP